MCGTRNSTVNYSGKPRIFVVRYNDRAKTGKRVANLRRNPSPSVKWKMIARIIWQDVEVSWIAGIIFQRGAMVLKFGKNFIFRIEIAISEIHLQQQIHDTGKE